MSYRKEVTTAIQSVYNKFYNWIKPDPKDNIIVQILLFLLKLPLILLVIAFSPILLILIFILFLIAI